MKITEKTLGIIAITGLILTLLEINIGITLLLIPTVLLSFLYLIFGFALLNNIRFRNAFKKSSYRSISPKQIGLTILLGITFFITLWLTQFKFQFWPGIYTIEMLNLPVIVCFIFIHFFCSTASSSKNPLFFKKIVLRSIIISICCFTILLIPNTMWVSIRFKNHPNFIKAVQNFEHDNSSQNLKNINTERDKMYSITQVK